MIINREQIRLLFMVFGVCLLLFIASVVLFYYDCTYNLQALDVTDLEFFGSQARWSAIRDIYLPIGFLSFVMAIVSGIMAFGLRRQNRLR